ncbi:hypothetical protein GCM10010191_41460 [Actinomadura vinacea]|uniref:DUF485 domain-containing protein n=1 Tax=Actinomadura vinacea TaxID=115336 RepID=A0ABN3JAV4_9ACTN
MSGEPRDPRAEAPSGGPAGPDGPAPGRVLVTGPRTRAARRPRYPVTREIDEQTGLGEAYMRSLVRAQLRLAVRLCLVLAAVVFGLPALFALFPDLRVQRPLGLPLAWVVLAGLVYPWFVVCGWWYVRQAERNERDFAELVDRAPGEDR